VVVKPTRAGRDGVVPARLADFDAEAEPADVVETPQAGSTTSKPSWVDAARVGYRGARPGEKATFLFTSTFALTIAASRTINYAREQGRSAPRLRHLGRLLEQIPGSNDVRVHHYLPGIGLSFISGAIALLRRDDAVQRLLTIPFAVGWALTSDELRLLAGRNNPYWGGQGFALVQSGVAGIAATGMVVTFVRRGLPTA
jgi:hypothetical protein